MSGLTHAQMSSRGGKSKSASKAEANRAKAAQFWAEVRAGSRPAPRHKKRRKTRMPNALVSGAATVLTSAGDTAGPAATGDKR